MTIDPVALAQDLVRRRSVTPVDDGAQDVLADALVGAGFAVERLAFGDAPVHNLFATIGGAGGGDGPHLALSGHTDVVPPGPLDAWTVDPFAGEVRDGMLWGRGASDMKSGVAALAAAAARFVGRHGPPKGRLSLLVTGDEEGPSVDGSARLIDWAHGQGHRFDACLVGEPTCPERLGDAAKIGRRGSFTGHLTANGVQGHVAYPALVDNAAHRMARLVNALSGEPLDGGTDHFGPSTLQVTTIDTGNPTHNLVPGRVRATFNVRFNDLWTPASLEAHLRERLDRVGGYDLVTHDSAPAFLTEPGPLSAMLQDAAEAVTGLRPALNTTGGTSDARFFAPHCPIVEFGLVNATIHQVDERVAVADIATLAGVYLAFIERFFGQGS
ncbi:MAG: succinyl-diaminopimelate desuccinylase [Geminicoccaceae bacterium]|nr:succinyl-diaminopimelate desuccinylase [Geminicoccaceae bacterium]